jgi:hypothetical protein
MISQTLDSQLSQFEAQLALLSEALLRRDSHGLVAASVELQSTVVLFSRALQVAAAQIRQDPQAQLRVKKIAAALSSVRQGLLRQSVVVDRALGALVPAAKSNTYAPNAGYGRQPYGSAGRQSGEFRALSA